MSAKRLHCAAMMIVVALSACSNGSGSLSDPPAASPGQVEPPATPAPAPSPTPTPTPPTPTPTPPPPTPPPPPPSPLPPASAIAGYWWGEIETKSGWSLSGRAFIATNGDAQLIVTRTSSLTASPELVVFGNVCCEAKVDVELQATRYLTDRVDGARFEAEREGSKLSGKFKVRGDDYKFSLDGSPRYDEALTLADLAGTYTRTITTLLGPSGTYTVTFDANGQLNGSHSNGCVYSGTASLPNAPRNLVKLNVMLSNCPSSITGSGSMNGAYTGFGALFKDVTAPSDPTQRADVLFHSLVGHTWLGPQPVER
jgi:hypothetical protein